MGFIVLPVAWLSPESDTADIVIPVAMLVIRRYRSVVEAMIAS
ncbi:hypothetical protein EV641_103179 [Rhodococcus sp. SMB37]|nr:hypothetical protein [Rhodococcus sp. SMB37]TCN55832.1 hypothetical protein EV641_103179 [Rhodococcus sp. SMB37]